METLPATQIAVTALLAQIALAGIVALAAAIIALNWADGAQLSHNLWKWAMGWVLLGVLPLAASKEVVGQIRPLAATGAQGLDLSMVIGAVFVVNVLFALGIIRGTGGAKRSPFTPVLLLLPTLAIFLNEPSSRVIGYFVMVVFAFTVSFEPTDQGRGWARQAREHSPRMLWFVTLASLLLTTLVGLGGRA